MASNGWRRGVVAGMIGIGLALAASGAGGARPAAALQAGWADTVPARQVAGATWEALPLPVEKPLRLEAPASGAFFLVHAGGLLRSDDGGSSWRGVELPPGWQALPERELIPGLPTITVDPTNHAVIYAAGADGLYKTDDDAQSWYLLSSEACRRGVVISQADPSLLYCLDRADFNTVRVMRSRDGGASWEEASTTKLDGFSKAEVFLPHPSDPARLFLSVSEHNGFNPPGRLLHSPDQGATWEPWGDAGSQRSWTMALVGGQGADPSRFYQLTNWLGDVDPSLRGVSSQRAAGRTWGVLRSDDGGQSWRSMDPRTDPSQQRGPGWARAPFIYDPAAPDRLYSEAPDGGVQASQDGGATWAPLGEGGPKDPTQLVLGIDRANLFALGEGAALYRLRLVP